MSSEQPVVAVLGRGVVPAGEPVVRADDRGVLRGDGLFETMHVRAGRPWLVREHLARLTRSAAALELPLPHPDELRGLLDTACAGWPVDTEGALRLVCTRGPEGGTEPTVYATLSRVPAAARRARRDGIRVATLPLGIAADARNDRPWLLGGLKTTSYGLSEAARRWAAGNGVDDVLWTSTDGCALEGPTANLVWLTGGELRTVPAEQTGILPGVTADRLLRHAAELGWPVAHRLVTPAGLRAADGVWFTSSVRGLAEVRELDGVPLAASPHTAVLADLLGYPVPPR
ncbi:aminotransferase IV [Plantactinospora sp. BC1]|uniref:aminotransferase class IV n=1 Tax=Plantactinospora sp. BC1 TaxID=2108470 RepID=UPI000D17ACE8|nr:aminotransferase class IV [Plantactinospora sp. BC1]AVT29992.1 aminotransferase IV [Plantactinospora sp. BC1]